jgi:hypothetical protein
LLLVACSSVDFLFSTKEPDAALKLIDFGLSKYIEKDSSGGKLRGALGSR